MNSQWKWLWWWTLCAADVLSCHSRQEAVNECRIPFRGDPLSVRCFAVSVGLLLGLLMEQGPLVFFTLWQIKMATVQSSPLNENSNSATAQLLRADADVVLNSPRAPFFNSNRLKWWGKIPPPFPCRKKESAAVLQRKLVLPRLLKGFLQQNVTVSPRPTTWVRGNKSIITGYKRPQSQQTFQRPKDVYAEK